MRNYKNEAEWAKEKYDTIHIKIDKELGQKFKERLKYHNIGITEFFKDRIKNFIESSK